MLGFHVCVVAMDIVMTSSVVLYTVLYLSLMILPLKKAEIFGLNTTLTPARTLFLSLHQQELLFFHLVGDKGLILAF